ncbi:MAG: SdrD B-like domain-containing protein, partial [Sphingomonadaceae bacterium]
DEDGSGSITLNDTLSYSVTATNSGTVTQHNVVVSDNKITPNTITCATLAPGATCVLTGSYTVTMADVMAGKVDNRGTVTSTETPDPVVSPVVSVPVTSIIEGITESGTAVAGTASVAIVDVRNNDTINGSTATSANSTIAQSGTWPAGLTLDPVTGAVHVAATALPGTYTIDYQLCDLASPVPNCTIVTDQVTVYLSDLSIAKAMTSNTDEDGSGSITLGDTLNYSVTATNSGTLAQTNVVVSDNKITPNTITCATLAPGATCVLSGSYVITQADVDAGRVDNTAQVTSTQTPDPVTSTIVTSPVVRNPLLTILKQFSGNTDEDGSGTVTLGDTLTYRILATNGGNTTLHDVVVRDDMITPSQKTCPTLAPGAQCGLTGSYTVTMADVVAGQVDNQARVTSRELPGPVTTPVVEVRVSSALGGTPESGSVMAGVPSTAISNVRSNDRINGRPATSANSTIAESGTWPDGITLDPVTGAVQIDGSVPPGSYTIVYQLCDLASPVPNCTLVTDTVEVTPALSSVTGTVYLDDNGNDVLDPDEQHLGGWIVELIRNGQVIATATTDANGSYSFSGLPSGAGYEIGFRNPDNNVLYGKIDGLDLPPGETVIDQNQPVDPSGVVYDAISRATVGGATVNLTDRNGVPLPDDCFLDPSQSGQVTGANGYYRFDIVPGAAAQCPVGETEYRLMVTPPAGYSFVSTILLPQGQALQPSGTGSVYQVSQSVGAPTRPDPVYYIAFLVEQGDPDIVKNHIPLDPFLTRMPLVVTKSSTKRSASTGDVVPYEITVRNTEGAQRAGVDVVDVLPAGLKYVPGTGFANGVAQEPETANSNREVIWRNQTIPANGSVTYSLVLVVGAGVTQGETVNTGLAENGIDGAEISNRGTAVVSIVPSAVFDCSELLGKVFDDRNGNGYQDEGEPGIPAARLATVNGELVTSDEFGRYHIACASVPDARIGSNFVLKLDERTLPAGWVVTTDNPRTVRLTRGKFGELNFGARQARLVAIDVDSRAFAGDTADLQPAYGKRLEALRAIDPQPLIIRASYRASEGESDDQIAERITSIKSAITRSFENGWDGPPPTIQVDAHRAGDGSKGE